MPHTYSQPFLPDFSHERELKQREFGTIVGIDEVGRGSLAGPVVAAAVILDENHLPRGIDDSKRLSAQRREEFFAEILHHALAIGVASLCARIIDSSNIRQATLETMRRAVQALTIMPDYALVDGRDIPPHLPCPAHCLIKGDQRALSIAAASIIAKVTRDKMMRQVATVFPAYGFDKHVGYGTKKHLLTLENHGGVAKLHRFSFAPLKSRLPLFETNAQLHSLKNKQHCRHVKDMSRTKIA